MAACLAHVRVLDLSRVLAGPWATQMLADLGADVIKVERPGGGDDTRAWGPPYMKDVDGKDTRETAYFLCANRNKRSVAIDLATAEGQAIVRDLALQSDVVVENFKTGGLKQYGLDYESLKAAAPHLVYCSITGFGQTGPYAQRAGYDFLIQGLGGLMSITGVPDGEPGAGPLKAGVALTDVMTGLYACNAILAALAYASKSGEGQQIDIALLDVQVACLANQALNFLTTGVAPRRLGNAHPSIVPYESFPTADGDVILAVGNDEQFARLCQAAGAEQLATDDQYRRNEDRVKNRRTLIPLLRRLTVTRTTSEWIGLLSSVGVPCGPVNDFGGVFADPQVIARELQIHIPHSLGTAPGVASPMRLSKTPVEYRSAAPLLGEHTRSVLEAVLGLDEKAQEGLRNKGIIK
ncbi:CoA transferase [Paraburkholderia sediminicola]|jgi:Predicted acyl-CoA transferases/carnitine dehydratase|nr:CoA transferase [Paraburkholderia sediminicola]